MNEELIVYILKLRGDKYYIGTTEMHGLDQRLKSHFNGGGSTWTKLHPPIEVVETIKGCSKVVEKLKTLEYMIKYGWQNVRGGAWSAVGLPKSPIAFASS